jgi:hypothetical protein
MCLDLQTEFSTKEMRDTMEFVRKTVDAVVEDMEAHCSTNGVIWSRGRYGPYHLLRFSDSKCADKDEAKKFEKAQLRCFAADYLYRPADGESGTSRKALVRPSAPHNAPLRAKEKTTRDVLDEHRRTWSFMFQKWVDPSLPLLTPTKISS